MAYGESENTEKKTVPKGLIPWQPGCPSPNPGGRPKGLASYIREKTLDGTELADFLINVMRGNEKVFCKMTDRLRAVEILLDRGFGKQPVIDGDKTIKPVLNLSDLTDKELEFLENVRLGLAAIHERVNGGTPQKTV